MSQKTIGTSLRLRNLKNWNNIWISKKNNYPKLLYINLEIKKYIQTILNKDKRGIFLINYKLKKISNTFLLYLYLPSHFKNKKLIEQIQKNIQLFLGKDYQIKIFVIRLKLNIPKNKNFLDLFHFYKKQNRINYRFKIVAFSCLNTILLRDPKILVNLIKNNVQKTKRQKRYIYFIKHVLKDLYLFFKTFKGYRIQFKGRLDGRKRSQKIVLQSGQIPLNTLSNNLYYYFDDFKTPSGVCSIKIWLCFNK